MQGAISHPKVLQVEGSWVPKLNGWYSKHGTTDYLGRGWEGDVAVVTLLGPCAADQTSSSYLKAAPRISSLTTPRCTELHGS